jgi:DUF917 family protein
VLRDVSVHAGGFIASARNPVEASWVKRNGAVGAISYALDLGASMRTASNADAVIEAVVKYTNGSVVAEGPVHLSAPVETRGGFDHGRFVVDDVELFYLNEYMAADRDGQRIATYPDVITTLSLEDGRPVAIADMREGMAVAVVTVDRSQFAVSSSASDRSALEEVQQIMGIDLVSYL